MIADDHRVFIEGLKSLLRDVEDLETAGDAVNGEELVEKALLLKPDVIITDIQMPLKDGIQACSEIHRQQPETKIIALTMLNEGTYIKKMLEAGASGYLLKTGGIDELLLAVRKVAAGEKFLGAGITEQLINDISKTSDNTVRLTKRECEILRYIAEGLTDKEIADKVFLSHLTVISHRKNLLSKLGLKNKVELTRYAIENKLL